MMIEIGSRACPFEHKGSPGVNKLWVYDMNGFTQGIRTEAQDDQEGPKHGGHLKDLPSTRASDCVGIKGTLKGDKCNSFMLHNGESTQ